MVESGVIKFKNKEHETFFVTYFSKCRYKDSYHGALVYCLGISEDTRRNIDRIYDFTSGCVKTECLHEGWQTSGSLRIIRMAFNLYNNGTPSVYDYDNSEEQLEECQRYTVEDLFCCGYALYFWQDVNSGRPPRSDIRNTAALPDAGELIGITEEEWRKSMNMESKVFILASAEAKIPRFSWIS